MRSWSLAGSRGLRSEATCWAAVGVRRTADGAVPCVVDTMNLGDRRSNLPWITESAGDPKVLVKAVAPNMPAADVGGSAMPCGLVLAEASANVAPAFWLPEVRLASPFYW